ncbi:MAG: UPF0147 family protein, partial [Candidatus Aenigmarchaeota archaeon]|nr:UPF0147 family protein [Candidatus Aenigmarchaeota archaeon]
MEIKQIVGMLENVMNERGVPRNVRESLANAAKTLDSRSRKESAKEKISQAISILDESANDPNLATYTRTQIWGIVSLLEGMKK